jgi:glutaredoxin
MKNTKIITEILRKVADKELTVEEATSTIQSMITSYSGNRAHPSLVINGKLVGKWCTKHQQYEPAEMFPKNTRSSDGLYSHCRYAEKRAKSYAAKVSRLKDKYFQADDEKTGNKIKAEIKNLEADKNDYDFTVDAPKDKVAQLTQFMDKHKARISALTAE